VLDGAADASSDVQLRCDDFARLSDLHVIGYESGVDSSSGRSYGCAEFISQIVKNLEVLSRLQTTATGHYDLCAGELGSF
jgi:hypothetical protein